jgi:hypothetical protein
MPSTDELELFDSALRAIGAMRDEPISAGSQLFAEAFVTQYKEFDRACCGLSRHERAAYERVFSRVLIDLMVWATLRVELTGALRYEAQRVRTVALQPAPP